MPLAFGDGISNLVAKVMDLSADSTKLVIGADNDYNWVGSPFVW